MWAAADLLISSVVSSDPAANGVLLATATLPRRNLSVLLYSSHIAFRLLLLTLFGMAGPLVRVTGVSVHPVVVEDAACRWINARSLLARQFSL